MTYEFYMNQKKLEQNYMEAIDEFKKRLSPHCKLFIYFQKEPKKAFSKNHYHILIKKGRATFSSLEFADKIKELTQNEHSTIVFLIGYSKITFDEIISVSQLDFSHSTTLLLLLEQIYRSYTIHMGKMYHK